MTDQDKIKKAGQEARDRMRKAIEDREAERKKEKMKNAPFCNFPKGEFVMHVHEVGSGFGKFGPFNYVRYTATALDTGEILTELDPATTVVPRKHVEDFNKRMIGKKFLVNYFGKVEDGGIQYHDLMIIDF